MNVPFSNARMGHQPDPAVEPVLAREPVVAPTPSDVKESVKPPVPVKEEPYPWILNPTIDILFACGGFFWLIFAYWAISGTQVNLHGNASGFSMAFLSIIGLQLLGDSHQPATMWRVYLSQATREKLGVKVGILGVIAAAAGLATLYIPSTTTFFLKLIFAWAFQHQLAQSYGVALIYCYKRKYYMNKAEKNVMFGMVYATVAYMICRMFAIKDFGTVLLNGYNVPFWGVLPEWVCTAALGVLQLSVVLFAAMIVRKYIRDKQLIPLPALLTVMTIVMMSFMTQSAFMVMWFLFSTWWYHSSQYLVVTSAFYFKERGLPENMPFSQIGRMLLTRTSFLYFGALFAVGFCAYYLLPMWLADHGINKGLAFASVYVAVNFHHFSTDAFIWKLRDPHVQKLLIS